MIAACSVLQKCVRKGSFQIKIRRLDLVLHHVQHASSINRISIAPTDSSTAAARLNPNETPEKPSTSTSNELGVAYTEAKQPSITEIDGTSDPDATDPELESRGQIFHDGSEQLVTPVPIVFKGFKPYKEQERKSMSQLSYSATKSNAEKIGSGPGHLSPSQRLQNVQTIGSNIETVHQPSNQNLCQFTRAQDEGGDESNATSFSTDSLFASVRNPKGTRTGTRPRAAKKSPNADRKPGQTSAKEQREPPFYRAIRQASVEDIEQKLAHTANNNPNVDGVQFMLKELLEVRHVRPQARHYEALILANCEARHGSAAALYSILAEMEQERIGIGASTLSAILKVLSIHPDAHLLSTTLSTLSSQWVTPTISDTISTILALVRLNQLELALPHLEHLIFTSPAPNNYLESPIPQFLYTTILYRLASPAISDHIAALRLLYLLTDNNLPISNVCVSYLLDSAAEALQLDLVLYIWRSHVDTQYIIPSTGLCRNALLTAARNGNSELAIKAGRVLEIRGNTSPEEEGGGVGLQVEELEMIREAFLGEGNNDENEIENGRTKRKGKWKVKVDIQAVNRLEKRMGELRRGEGKRDLARRQWEREKEEKERLKEEEREREEMQNLEGEGAVGKTGEPDGIGAEWIDEEVGEWKDEGVGEWIDEEDGEWIDENDDEQSK